MQCSKCNNLICTSREYEKAPVGCPTVEKKDIFQRARKKLENAETLKTSQVAAHVEVTGYMEWPRVQELIVFATKMGYKKLGMAFCVGLKEEAKVLTQILEKNDFEVVTGICTIGSLQKKEMEIPDQDTFSTAEEVGCNPIGQAYFLNSEKTDLNIVVGLCIGHDINFIKHSEAPTTVLIVKDRVTTHNPVAVLYSRYYKNKYFNID
ncbi:MAG: DUF1847 domain-containing protein [Candidatus Heimdallarchaeota archaeon]|nr:DUF1847 domain-containing protein [Candidatus Heimdallarchaeota archaeon]MCK5297988.1 DUF1847 domain-containing protein [Candidatus Heimdallarchaeota archaeon]